MFEYTGLALPSIEVFNVKGGNTLGVGKTATDLTESSDSNSSTGDSSTKEATIAENTEFSLTGEKNTNWNQDTALASSYFTSYTSSAVSKIVVSVSFDSSVTWGSSIKIVIGSDWVDTGSWADGIVTFTITDATQIAEILSNGVIFGSDYNGKGYATVTVTYTE